MIGVATERIDFAFGVALFAVVLVGAAAWLLVGRARSGRSARVEAGGGSVWLPQSTQRGGYFFIEPVGRALAALGVSANAVTLASIPLALAAGVAFAFGHYGVGAFVAALSFLCDTLDGIVARTQKSASDAGEVLDAAADRICESLLLGGIAIHVRGEPLLLALVLAAGLGAQQVTFASAKIEIYRVDGVPRGAMRRAERAVYLVTAAATTAVVAPFSPAWALTPVLVGLGLIALVGNVSAVTRFVALARGLRARDRKTHDGVTEEGQPHAAE